MRAALIRTELGLLIRPLKGRRRLRAANYRIVMLARTIAFGPNVGSGALNTVNFNLVKRLWIDVIHRCDFLDARVETNRQRLQFVKLTAYTAVLSVKYQPLRSWNMTPNPGDQEFIASTVAHYKNFALRGR